MEQHGPDGETRADRLFRRVSQAGVVVIAFIAGSLMTAANLFPGTEIANAYRGGKALYDQATQYDDVLNTDLWNTQRTPRRGVVVNAGDAVQPGVTLYTSGQSASAFLVDAKGKVLHEWHRPFSTVWNAKKSSIRKPQPDSHVYFRKAAMYPNGDLVAVYEGAGDTPYGYGVVKLDKDSNVKWVYFGRAHHDVDVGPDGRIYVLTHGFANKPDPDFGNLATPRLLDTLVILNADGSVQQEIPLLDAVAKSRYRQLLFTVSQFAVADPLHANNAEVITKETAKNFPYGKAGQVLVSFRELGAIGVVDPKTGTLVWATRGPWLGQHDPDLLTNGHIILFDNYGNFGGETSTSRVLEFDPKTIDVVWQYSGTPTHPLGSLIRGSQQRLQNGNTLITESSGGRILEVAGDGRIVWEYVDPVRDGHAGETPKLPIVCGATRIDSDTIDPAVLTPQKVANTSLQEQN